ncbi:hypothetical protein QN379_23505, partial [Glaciimonas sp. Gout2]|uniref:hypothetical protein n=1 Tax=unclassified Glaciimonas TaxID=2644401 RepID=UPI002B236991
MAEAIFRDFFGIVGGAIVGGLTTVGMIPYTGVWAPEFGYLAGEAYAKFWNQAFDDAKNTSKKYNFGGRFYDFLHPDEAARDFFNHSRTYRYDPLVLDLDGDGIETVGNKNKNNIYFDNNNDGIKTATGWVGADDGLLVMDRNGNGVIDNGTEL